MKKCFLFLAILSGILFSCKNNRDQPTLPGKKGTKMKGHVSNSITALPMVIPVTPDIDPQPKPAVKPLAKNYSLEPDSGRLELSNIDATDGLPEDRFYGILQDRVGNLWLSSEAGLLKYDGSDIVSYPRVNDLYAISVIQEDPRGNLFLLGSDFSRYDGKTFENVRGLDSIKLSGMLLVNMEQDPTGNFWFPVRDKLVKYDGIKLTVFTLKDGLSGDEVRDVALDPEGNVYILQLVKEDKFRFSVLKLDGKKFIPFIGAAILPPNAKIQDIQFDDKGNTWLGTDGSGVLKYDGKKISIYTTKDGLAENSVRYIVKDKSGGLWFSHLTKGYSYFDGLNFQTFSGDEVSIINTFTPGISPGKNGNAWIAGEGRVKKVDKSFATYEDLLTGINGLSISGSLFNPINAVTSDRKGNLWFCNHNSTVFRYNGKTMAAFSDTANFGVQVSGIIEDRKGNIWFATGRGITQYDGQFFKTYKKANGLGENRVSRLIEDRSGNLWFTTTNAIHQFDGVAFTRYPVSGNNNNIAISRSLYEDSRGNIWFGWRGRGVSRFDGKIFTDYTRADGLADTSVNSIAEDDYGNMWFATDNGLNRYDGNMIWRYSMDDGLSSNEINQILKDTINQVCWLRTANGITRMTQTANHPDSVFFLNFDRRNGFPVPPGNSFLDTDGTIWLTGAKNKLTRFDYASLKDQMRPFSLHLKNISLNNEKVCWSNFLPAGKKDSLLLETEMQIRFGKTLSEEVLAQMKDQHKGLRFDSILPFDYIPQNLVLPYSSNTISFDFAAIDPYFSKFTRYQYKLEGLSKSWSSLGKNASANFGNLKEGRYTFKLKALNSYGLWSDMSYSFRIMPPWWRTWWAYTLFALFFISAVFLFIRWRTKALKKEKIVLEEKVTTRTAELKESLENLKATQSQLIQSEKMASLGELTAGIAHEIQNPLNFVNNFSEVNTELIEELEQEAEKGNLDDVKAIAKDIKENEQKINHHGKRADAIVKGMLQHSRSSNGVKEPTDINALCDEYLRLAYHGLRAKDNSFNAAMIPIAIGTDFDENIGNISIVPQDIGRVILNLINNAFYAASQNPPLGGRGAKHEPTVSVGTKKVGDKVLIVVKDNGPGIPQKLLDKIFQPFFTTKPTGEGTGLGLSLSYDIVKAHGGEISVETQPGEGSAFVIQLPII